MVRFSYMRLRFLMGRVDVYETVHMVRLQYLSHICMCDVPHHPTGTSVISS